MTTPARLQRRGRRRGRRMRQIPIVSREKVFLIRQSNRSDNRTISANIIRHRYPYLYNYSLNEKKDNNDRFKWSIIQIIDGFSNNTEAEKFFWTWKKQSRGPKRRINEGINLVRKWKRYNPFLKIFIVPLHYQDTERPRRNPFSYR